MFTGFLTSRLTSLGFVVEDGSGVTLEDAKLPGVTLEILVAGGWMWQVFVTTIAADDFWRFVLVLFFGMVFTNTTWFFDALELQNIWHVAWSSTPEALIVGPVETFKLDVTAGRRRDPQRSFDSCAVDRRFIRGEFYTKLG